MTVTVEISYEEERGCGFRKPASDGVGVYLMGPSEGRPCGRLPFALHACPTCGSGIKPGRGWQWIEPRKLFHPAAGVLEPCVTLSAEHLRQCGYAGVTSMRELCRTCPLGVGLPDGKHGLVWIGEGFYATAADFMSEARRMGISRKIRQIPKDFQLGTTFVYLAHRHAVDTGEKNEKGDAVLGPAVFTVFKPTGIDLVIADETKVPEKAERLAEKYGARIVKVVPKPAAVPEPAQQSLALSAPRSGHAEEGRS
jgi:hypothetical protein